MGSGDCLEAMHFRALTSRARILYFIALSISQWCFSNLCWSNRFSFRWSAGEDYGTDIIRLEEFFTTGKNQRAILKDQPFALFRKNWDTNQTKEPVTGEKKFNIWVKQGQDLLSNSETIQVKWKKFIKSIQLGS